MDQPFHRAFRIRHYECDMYGHVNNAVYLRYLQQANIEAEKGWGYLRPDMLT
jgi:acyl-CoA thioesterase FadM